MLLSPSPGDGLLGDIMRLLHKGSAMWQTVRRIDGLALQKVLHCSSQQNARRSLAIRWIRGAGRIVVCAGHVRDGDLVRSRSIGLALASLSGSAISRRGRKWASSIDSRTRSWAPNFTRAQYPPAARVQVQRRRLHPRKPPRRINSPECSHRSLYLDKVHPDLPEARRYRAPTRLLR